jgi:hypothetical protein
VVVLPLAQLAGLVVAEAVISDQVVLVFLDKDLREETEMETLN